MAKKSRSDGVAVPLSRRERQIMDIVYRLGESTVAQVRAAMDDAPSRNAVRTLMGILEAKGQLKHREEGRTYVYRPSTTTNVAGQSALRRALDTFFGGSWEQALSVFLASPQEEISIDELSRIEAMIKNARGKGPKK